MKRESLNFRNIDEHIGAGVRNCMSVASNGKLQGVSVTKASARNWGWAHTSDSYATAPLVRIERLGNLACRMVIVRVVVAHTKAVMVSTESAHEERMGGRHVHRVVHVMARLATRARSSRTNLVATD